MLKQLSSLAFAFVISLIFISTSSVPSTAADDCTRMVEQTYKDTRGTLSRNFPDHFDEALISLLEACREGRVIEMPAHRLSAIAKNKQIDEFRKLKRRELVDFTDPKTLELLGLDRADTALSPYDKALSQRLSERMVATLSPAEVDILYRSASGQTQAEIAEAHGISEPAAQKRMTRVYPKVEPIVGSARNEYLVEKITSAPHDSGSWLKTFAVIVGLALAAAAILFGLSCLDEAIPFPPTAANAQPAGRSSSSEEMARRAVAMRKRQAVYAR